MFSDVVKKGVEPHTIKQSTYASYRHRYGVFIRLDLCTGLRMGELLALK